MNKKEAVTQLKIMATNATGRLGSAKSEEEKALLNKQIEALNMAMDALKDYKPKTGHWIEDDEQIHVEKTYHCSECGYGIWGVDEKSDYCPKCGAKMGGNEDER